MSLKTRLESRRKLNKTIKQLEDPEDTAARFAENYVREFIQTNLRFRDAYAFVSKRIPSKDGSRRYEIDLIIVTKKQIHVIEVKNWSGSLKESGQSWIQTKRDGRVINHQKMTDLNSTKSHALQSFLRSKNVSIESSFFITKIVFVNKRLRIDPVIENDPRIVTYNDLDKYMNQQKGTSFGERLIHSIIEHTFTVSKRTRILKKKFSSMTQDQFEQIRKELESLRSWDKLLLFGGKILTGDALYISHDQGRLNLKDQYSGYSVKFKWTRNKGMNLIKAIGGSSLGTAKTPNGRIPLNAVSNYIKFHPAGQVKPSNFRLIRVENLILG
jgi:Holliday junction resolvase-like predicted endonuclease